jgi:hypothetical protein
MLGTYIQFGGLQIADSDFLVRKNWTGTRSDFWNPVLNFFLIKTRNELELGSWIFLSELKSESELELAISGGKEKKRKSLEKRTRIEGG